MTPEQQSLVDAISAVLQRDSRIEAAWLAGSLGRNAGDRFSDVDVVVLCPDGMANEIAATPDLLDFAKPVLVNALFGGRIVNVITPDWQRFDLVFVEASDLGRYNANDLKPLFNRTGREPPRTEPVTHGSTPEGLAKLVKEFYRVMTLAPLGIGRKEYVVALSGIELLRRMTVDLMLEENGIGQNQRGGALRLNPFLTSEQIELLQSLPAVAAERDSLLRSQKAIANIFVPRAKALAARIGMEWPSALEEASRAHLKSQLDFEI
jgi:predicted nucleotidyltransferase